MAEWIIKHLKPHDNNIDLGKTERDGEPMKMRMRKGVCLHLAILVSIFFVCANNSIFAKDLEKTGGTNHQAVNRQLPGEEVSKRREQVPFCKGAIYVSWTTGDYPYTTAWKRQTYRDSQGIKEVAVSISRALGGKGSLELNLDIRGKTETHRKGEVFLDLRYMPRYRAQRTVVLKHDDQGQPLGVDLSGKTLGAAVLCENGLGGSPPAPNGVQLFLKSIEIKNGTEVWGSFYGNWHNIWKNQRHSDGGRSGKKALQLGDIREGQWSLVTLQVPNTRNGSFPLYGYADPDFNPKQVALVGLKFGLNESSHQNVSGRIWVDDLGWKDILCNGRRNGEFQLWMLNHPEDLEVWERLGRPDVPWIRVSRSIFFQKQVDVRTTGNSVLFDFESTDNPITSLIDNGFNAVGVVNTEYMDDVHSTIIEPLNGKSHTTHEMIELIRAIHNKGMRVMLKPHIDLKNDAWRGDICPPENASPNEAAPLWLDAWFDAYTRFILKYSEMAENEKVEIFCVGTEFKKLIGAYRARWEKVVRKVREVYSSGSLTYAANWDNYENVCLWDLVDIIGIDAYFPLSAAKDPSLEALVKGWSSMVYKERKRNWVNEIESFQKKVKKPLVFSEIGYRSVDYAARTPWEYREEWPLNPGLQRRSYEAVLKAFKDKRWFRGCFFWLWSPKLGAGGMFDGGFTPQGKPAESVFLDVTGF